MTSAARGAVCSLVLRRRSLVVALVVLAVSFSPVEARAELPAAEAETLFQQGLTAFDAGQHQDAIEAWTRLVEAGDPARVWRVRYNLALAHEARGERARALEQFEAFARAVGEQPGSLPIEFEGRRQDAVDRAKKLRPEVAMLRVLPSKGGDRVPVRVNGGPARDAGFALYLEPGSHQLEMGERARMKRRTLTLTKGELFTLIAEQLPPPPAPPPPPYRPPVPIPIVISGGASAGASLVVPIALFFRAQGLREDADLDTRDPGYPEAREAFTDARTEYLASWALPSALAATTLALLIVDVVDASSDTVKVRVDAAADHASWSLAW